MAQLQEDLVEKGLELLLRITVKGSNPVKERLEVSIVFGLRLEKKDEVVEGFLELGVKERSKLCETSLNPEIFLDLLLLLEETLDDLGALGTHGHLGVTQLGEDFGDEGFEEGLREGSAGELEQ